MTCHTVIVAHQTRTHWAKTLADNTGAHHISLDDGHLGCYRNHLTAWQWHQHHPTPWAVTLEDDALPAPDYRNQLTAALAAAPTPIISLYLGRQRPPQHQQHIAAALIHAAQHHHAWIVSNKLIHAVGIALRADLITPILNYTTTKRHLDFDEALTQWAQRHQHLIAYTVPSLIDHRDTKTIAQHRDSAPRTPGRVAWHTGSRNNWTTDTTSMAL